MAIIGRKFFTVGVIGAMKAEIDALKPRIENCKTLTLSGIEFVYGDLFGMHVVAAVCGIGKVFAAICAEAMIVTFQPDVIINAGVGGSLTDKLEIGGAGIATAVVQHDMDTTPLGDPKGLISGINKVYFDCDKTCVELLEEAAEEHGINHAKGVIASGDCFVNSAAKRDELRKEFSAIVCEMESGAIGHVCCVNDVPFGVLRTISDNGDESSHNDYSKSLAKAAVAELEILESFLEKLGARHGN
ncbi:5'-methylthioadenosine/adenosylhomocysteine nucleosidase [Ruminococcus sp.]|uniref:5'-methylthioadenosine/adenosylhomocysteine nucleosidase n=1 Tax=Ruminococcus sp. TaxID=41978 RepID=UPI0025EAF227|nr:5'-methylthioadenosine/adenosylhomocysteine nucleosidase [Ruminococcus sp.]MBQ8967722.1 5'-methylthioadenosine/adenosylhomocysteine nucleosidase [Ruminococcus sp.]